MHLPISSRIALCALLLSSTLIVHAQTAQPGLTGDFAVTFLSHRSLNADSAESFWMEGGSAELGFLFTHGFGVAADYTETHTNSTGSTGVPLTFAVFAVGPRYRWHANKRISVYGEGLIGAASGSDSLFPSSSGTTSNANSFAVQLGGGLDFRLSHVFAIRALDAGYVRTTLPNGAGNEQNTLRLGAGIVFRFGNR